MKEQQLKQKPKEKKQQIGPPVVNNKLNKTSPTKPTPSIVELQKKLPNNIGAGNSSNYKNGMSYAAKSAMKLNEDKEASSSKSLENSSNLIITEEFPPVTSLHKPVQSVVSKPTVASLFQTNRNNIKQNSIKIPTQAVAPLPQQQPQQQPQEQSRSLSPIKKPGFSISPDVQRCDSVEPNKNNNIFVSLNKEEKEDKNGKYEIFNPLLNEKLGLIVTPPPIVLNEIELEGNVIPAQKKPIIAPKTTKMTITNKKPNLFPDFKDNGKDLDIDSTQNTPNVDSPKKAVGAERPIGFKPTVNLPTAIVAPVPITKPIGPPPPSAHPSIQHQQILRDLIGNDNIPQQIVMASNQQHIIKTTPPPGLQNLSPLENNNQFQTTQQKLYNPLISTQFCELPTNAQMNPQMLQMILNNNTSNNMILNSSFINNQQNQQYSFINSQTKLVSNNQIIKQELHPIGSTRPNKFPQHQQQQHQNKLNFNAPAFQKLSMMNGCSTTQIVNEKFE